MKGTFFINYVNMEDNVLIWMGSIVLDNCYIESGSIIAAGAVLKEGSRIEVGSIRVGLRRKKRISIS